MKNLILIKENGIVRTADTMEELEKNPKHMCWDGDCKNACPNNCPKIEDLRKRTIDKYSFITDGFQVIKNGEITQFVVTKCNNYEKEPSKKITAERKRELGKLKEDLYKAYYGAETMKEAREIHKYEMKMYMRSINKSKK